MPSKRCTQLLLAIDGINSLNQILSAYKWVKYPKSKELYLNVGYLFINISIFGTLSLVFIIKCDSVLDLPICLEISGAIAPR